MEVEDLEPDIDQLDDGSSPQFFAKSGYLYAKRVDYHETNYFEQESYMSSICQEIQQNSYGLRPRMKQATSGKKKVRNAHIKEILYFEKK